MGNKFEKRGIWYQPGLYTGSTIFLFIIYINANSENVNEQFYFGYTGDYKAVSTGHATIRKICSNFPLWYSLNRKGAVQ